MEPEIVDLARRMRDAFEEATGKTYFAFWHNVETKVRLAWVAAAAVARPDLVVTVGPEHWLAPLFGPEAKR